MFASKKAGRAAAPVDPNFPNVTLLLPGDGTNGAQNNTFTDSSTNNFTITRNGNTTQGSFSPYGSNWSNFFGGSGNYITTAANTASNFSGDFTIEFWIFPTASIANSGLIGTTTSSLRFDSGGFFYLINTGSQYVIPVGGSFFTLNVWTHCAITRSGSTIRFFKNGVSIAIAENAGDANTATFTFSGADIGRSPHAFGGPFTGYLSNVRMVNGTALYTSDFTPPIAPLTAVAGTSLLTCQSNRFLDASTNNLTITRTGSPQVQRFSPFSPSSAYLPSTDGGSAYFDGTGDYLDVPHNVGLTPPGDFTIEFWAYPITASGLRMWYSKGAGIQVFMNNGSWFLALSDTNGPPYYVNASFGLVVANAWQHIVVTRSGNSYVGFVNGVATALITSAAAPNTGTNVVRVGEYSVNPIYPAVGYMAAIRLVNGTAVYGTSNFTPPTAPLTPITNTRLLLNATNAGVIDNAAMNNLETVGSAQITTTRARFGIGSVSLPTNGSYLALPNRSGVTDFGTANFTLEAWVFYVAGSQPTFPLLFANGPGDGDALGHWAFYLNHPNAGGGGTLYYSDGALKFRNFGGTPTDNAWNHVALVRNNGVVSYYLNGTSRGTTVTITTTMTNSSGLFTIGVRTGAIASTNFIGQLDDIRISLGVARYVANFTPPALPFPNQ